jgi:release factor glutamine methyltransferase
MKLGTYLAHAEKQLNTAGISSARLDVLIMLEDALHKDRAWILAHPEQEVNKVMISRLNRKVARRAGHTPLAYIRGHSEFYGRSFKVNRYLRGLHRRGQT